MADHTSLRPTRAERRLVARCMIVSGILAGSEDEIWRHQIAGRTLRTWRLCIEAISELIGGGHGLQASFVKACVMHMTDEGDFPFALDEVAEFLLDDDMARMYWNSMVTTEYWPHRCPHCNAAAFVGFLQVDCKARCPESVPR